MQIVSRSLDNCDVKICNESVEEYKNVDEHNTGIKSI